MGSHNTIKPCSGVSEDSPRSIVVAEPRAYRLAVLASQQKFVCENPLAGRVGEGAGFERVLAVIGMLFLIGFKKEVSGIRAALPIAADIWCGSVQCRKSLP